MTLTDHCRIKIAPIEYRIRCTYEEALLYGFQLEIDGESGWRIPTKDESIRYAIYGWFLDHDSNYLNHIPLSSVYYVRPVRDI